MILSDLQPRLGILIVFGRKDTTIYALDGESGNELWNYTTGDSIGSSPAIEDLDNDDTVEFERK